MAQVTVVDDGGQTRTIDISESTFGVIINGDVKHPAATQSVEVESNGQMEKTGTQCGTTRQQRTASDPFSITVECIVVSEDSTSAPDALTVRDVLYGLQSGSEVFIESAFPIDSPQVVSNVLVRQETELISVKTKFTNGEATAFRCQLQFGAEESE